MPIEIIKKNSELVEQVEQFLETGYQANEDFNETISEGELVTIRSLNDSAHEYEYKASEVLFWVDRNVYLDELENWSGNKIKEQHLETVEYILNSNQKAVFLDLIELIRRDKIAPFLGAGVSRAAGYPLWGEALYKLGQKVNNQDKDNIQKLLNDGKYLEAAQMIFNASEPQLNNYITTIFRTKYDTDKERELIPLIFRLLPRLSNGCIVTTNFDSLIEEAFKSKGSPLLDGYMHGIQPGHNFVQRLLKGDRCLLKLHGDASQPLTYVFTEKQYEEAYGTPIDYSRQLPKALRQIYISNSLLFLGCSLAQDRTLELFKEVKDSNQFEIPNHFAIISDPEEEQLKQETEDRLLAINIRPIWYKSDNNHGMATKLIELAVDMAERRVSFS
jgi:hypothetical protein